MINTFFRCGKPKLEKENFLSKLFYTFKTLSHFPHILKKYMYEILAMIYFKRRKVKGDTTGLTRHQKQDSADARK